MSDNFLKVDGIDGDSVAEGHEDEIELTSWNFGSSVSIGSRSSGGSGAEKTSIHSDVNCTKLTDASSNKLNEACWLGKTIPNVVLTVQRQGSDADNKIDFIRITLTNVIVSSFSTSGGDGMPTETFNLNYETIKREYQVTDVSGASKGWQEVGLNAATGGSL